MTLVAGTAVSNNVTACWHNAINVADKQVTCLNKISPSETAAAKTQATSGQSPTVSAEQRRLDGRGEIDVGRGSFPAYIKAEFWRPVWVSRGFRIVPTTTILLAGVKRQFSPIRMAACQYQFETTSDGNSH